ncbi:hypothetical protein [Halomarina rubra]|uniref:Outer membrane lipoprotein-sorting protein n=1 Tax=Halomarina rubra TaxID=2071873 RepID=A0ABD6AYV6_9EURY|nr:hypothetical protein [Halomarina rubra]
MHRAVVAVVACLLVLAGCGTDGVGERGGLGTPAAPVTPAPVPGDRPAPADTEATEEVAPGVTNAGVVDSGRLVAAHVEHVRGRSVATTRRTVVYGVDGRVRSSAQTRAFVGADRRRAFVDHRVAGPPAGFGMDDERVQQYVAGETVFARTVSNGTERFASSARDPYATTGSALVSNISTGPSLATAFAAFVFDVAPHAGAWAESRYRLRSTTDPERGALAGLADERAQDVSFMATVTDEGLVTWWRMAYTTDRDGETVRVVRTVSFDGVGTTTVERPGWVDDARRKTARAAL